MFLLFISLFFSIQRAYGTLKQYLVKFKYTQAINEEVKPSGLHYMAQKIQISDFLVELFVKKIFATWQAGLLYFITDSHKKRFRVTLSLG